jgi:antibiotic biosynthesis monooxygenase (ABM) superfamily enzyme
MLCVLSAVFIYSLKFNYFDSNLLQLVNVCIISLLQQFCFVVSRSQFYHLLSAPI